MSGHLFAYGTLMFAPVWDGVVGQARRKLPARLHGFARFGLRGEVFPGLVGRAGSHVDGVAYLDLSEDDWQRLDDFEADFYERWTVQVETTEGTLAAETYVVAPAERRHVTGEAWDPAAFEREQLARYVRKLGW